jgi:hypothetical protein
MYKVGYSALSAGDRKVANRLHRILPIVYSSALVLLGAFAITSSKCLAPTTTAEGDVRSEMSRNIEARPVVMTK